MRDSLGTSFDYHGLLTRNLQNRSFTHKHMDTSKCLSNPAAHTHIDISKCSTLLHIQYTYLYGHIQMLYHRIQTLGTQTILKAHYLRPSNEKDRGLIINIIVRNNVHSVYNRRLLACKSSTGKKLKVIIIYMGHNDIEVHQIKFTIII